jgi:flagellar basal-body rod modification protein FlgD
VIEALAGAGTVSAPDVTLTPTNPGGEMGRDEFLQLLVAQLKNQDPMNPLNAEEFAAQLAQFSSLEQLMNINESIGAQIDQTGDLMAATNQATALEVVGREVLAVGNSLDVGEDGPNPIVLGVGGEGGSGYVTIYNEEGSQVGRIPVNFDEGGRHEVEFTGPLKDLEPGRYSYEVELQDGDDSPVSVQTFSRIQINGVRYGPGGPVLMSGDLEIPLSNVVEVLAKL